jgi:hypothetical protein
MVQLARSMDHRPIYRLVNVIGNFDNEEKLFENFDRYDFGVYIDKPQLMKCMIYFREVDAVAFFQKRGGR